MTAEAKIADKVKLVLVCLRHTETTGGKRGIVFYRLSPAEWAAAQKDPPEVDQEDTDRACVFLDKNWKHTSAGQVFEVESTDDVSTTIYPSTQRYLGLWPDEDARRAWRLFDETNKVDMELAARQKREAKDDPVADALAPLRDQYRRTIGGVRRAALLARIIQYVTG